MNTALLDQSAKPAAAPIRERPWDRLLTHARSASLDRQLAAEHPAPSSHALAVRARMIVSLGARQELVERWAHVLDQAFRRPVPRSPRGPLRRGAITAAEGDVRAMMAVLASDAPVGARGAAMASWLLSDGTGPLYNRRAPVKLGAAVREATKEMRAVARAKTAASARC
jgi:hypothetical protein